MAKVGDAYQHLVAAVERALDPGAEVVVGEWVEGPDGRRDMDVSVRGFKDGLPHFVLIECKDWKEPVGIGVIDAFESKRRDLGADVAVVFSNSGFTAGAARKAQRSDIQLASALKAGDPLVHVQITRTFVARRHSVERWNLLLLWNKDRTGPEDFHPFDVTYGGLPLVNWIREDSLRLLRDHPAARSIQAEYAFLADHPFTIRGHTYLLTGVAYRLECADRWVSQVVREDVTLGSFDFIRKRVVVPDQQSFILGPFDQGAWVAYSPPALEEAEMEPGTFALGLTLLAPVNGMDSLGVPDLDPLIKERAVTVIP